MRQIQVVVPDKRAREFMALLSRYDKNPLHTKATGPFDTIIVTVEDEKVDEVVEALKRRGLEKDGSIIILPSCITITEEEEKEAGYNIKKPELLIRS